jgi:hypothetical protein
MVMQRPVTTAAGLPRFRNNHGNPSSLVPWLGKANRWYDIKTADQRQISAIGR